MAVDYTTVDCMGPVELLLLSIYLCIVKLLDFFGIGILVLTNGFVIL